MVRPPVRHLRLALVTVVVCVLGALASCGAENDVAPAAVQQSDIHQCQGFEQLMPNFVNAIDTGQTKNLKELVETQLLTSDREDLPPPVNEVLRSIFETLTRFAQKPPEANAPDGEFCAPTDQPPPLSQANELCEMRRSLDLLVHQGKGIDAVNLIEPQLLTTVNYVTGEGLDCRGRARTPHYEVAGLVSGFCAQNLNCQLNDGLDVVIALTDYLNTPDGRVFGDHLKALGTMSSITGLLNTDSLTENDFVNIARTLLTALQGADAEGLRQAFDSLPLPENVKTDLQPLVDDLVKVLMHPEIVRPLKASLNCLTSTDRNFDLVRMLYRLSIEEQCQAFTLTEITTALQGVIEVDARGSLIFIVNVLAKSVRNDELAVDSAADVCRTIFSTARGPDTVRSNAELALPVAGQLVEDGVINEAFCAVDTLLFGCAGGPQPACR